MVLISFVLNDFIIPKNFAVSLFIHPSFSFMTMLKIIGLAHTFVDLCLLLLSTEKVDYMNLRFFPLYFKWLFIHSELCFLLNGNIVCFTDI